MVFLLALLAERRREFATMRAVGAIGRQLTAFVLAEAGLIGLCGLVVGALIGIGLATMLVTILISIFDPPPGGPLPSAAPLLLLGALYVGSMTIAVIVAVRRMRRMRVSDALREA